MWRSTYATRLPVHGVQHFYEHKNTESHGHWLRMSKNGAIYAFEATFLRQALCLMCLQRVREPMSKILFVGTDLFMALSISISTRTLRAMVIGLGFVKMRQSIPLKFCSSAKHCM